MDNHFGETLSRLRKDRGLSQQELADRLHVTRSAVANWETGNRTPAASTFQHIAHVLDTDIATLIAAADETDAVPNIVLVDDSPIALEGMLSVLRDELPGANVVGLSRPAEALDYFETYPVALAFLDIEIGKVSGLDLCRELPCIQPNANVVYLTAYREYALDAWGTEACGFMLKPITAGGVREQLKKLRYPFLTGGVEA
jgi:transcriptional regulator with XRE-family HTH domain